MSHQLTFLDVFAGCGGFSCGLESAGLSGVGAVERDQWACETLRYNFPQTEVIEREIQHVDDFLVERFRGVDVIVGGPPCQGFSVAGTTQFGVIDTRNELVYWLLHWVSLIRPKAVVIENVPGILTKPDKTGNTVIGIVRQQLEPMGYSVNTFVLNAVDYGAPQSRRRAFIVAVRGEVRLEAPPVSHVQVGSSGGDLFGSRQASHVTVSEAISDLPAIDAGEGQDELTPYPCPPRNAFQEMLREGSLGVANHIAMRHTARLIERFKTIKAGQSLKDVDAAQGQKAKITGEIVENPFKYNNYRLPSDAPSLAIPASFQSLFLHPSLDRNLTAREAARLMTFPDRFHFQGKRTTMSWEKHLSQYNQIGNAVCPVVAEALGRVLRAAVARAGSFATAPFVRAEIAMLSRPSTSEPKAATTRLNSGARQSVALRIPEAAPYVEPLSGPLLELFEAAGRELVGPKQGASHARIKLEGFEVPFACIPVALAVASFNECPFCRHDLAPHRVHAGSIPFLISKESTDSLPSREKDHGLDYHLRMLLGIDHQCAHLIGDLIAELRLGSVAMIVNPRTGRKVRGLEQVVLPERLRSAAAALQQFGRAATATAA